MVELATPRDVEIRINSQVLRQTLTRMGQKLPEKMRDQFDTWATYAKDRFIAARLTGGGGLRRRTGQLARSWFRRTKGGTYQTIEATIGTRSPYAAPHEYGAVIRPKVAKKLAIPFPGGPALTRAGVFRYGAGSLRNTLPKHIQFFTITSKSGALILMGRDSRGKASGMAGGRTEWLNKKGGRRKGPGKQGEAQPWFILVDRVQLRPRLKFFRTIRLYFRVLSDRLKRAASETFRNN